MQSLEDSFPTKPSEHLRQEQESAAHVPLTESRKPVERNMVSTHIQLSVPHNGTLVAGTLLSVMGASVEGVRVNLVSPGISLLVRNFNNCWCIALNAKPRPEFFVMHHSDIMAERGWLDKLVHLMDETRADIISSNIPMKDNSGELSTAVFFFDNPAFPRGTKMRVDEINQLPRTFTMVDVEKKFPDKYKGGTLMVNSGLWICRFRDAKKILVDFPDGVSKEIPWIENFCFHMQDTIVCNNGSYEPHGISEDWQASLDWKQFELDYRATSEVGVFHFGTQAWELNVHSEQS